MVTVLLDIVAVGLLALGSIVTTISVYCLLRTIRPPCSTARGGRLAASESSERLSEADYESVRIRDLKISFSPFRIPGRVGREPLLDKIPMKGIDSTNSENHPSPTTTHPYGYAAKIDDTVTDSYRGESRVWSAVGDVEPNTLVEGDRSTHIGHGQRHGADVVDRPRRR
jgi:hypothetical protein